MFYIVLIFVFIDLFGFHSSAKTNLSLFIENNPRVEILVESTFSSIDSTLDFPVSGERCYASPINYIIINNEVGDTWSLTVDSQNSGDFSLHSENYTLYYQIFSDTTQGGNPIEGALMNESGAISENEFNNSNSREIVQPGTKGNYILNCSSESIKTGFQLIISGKNWELVEEQGAFNQDRIFQGHLIWTYILE